MGDPSTSAQLDQPPAQVGDIISYRAGRLIPDNVVKFEGGSPTGFGQRNFVLVVEVGNGDVSYWITGHPGEQYTDEEIPRFCYPLTVLAVRPFPADPLVLHLPPLPEGTTALVGVESGRQYDARPHGQWATRVSSGGVRMVLSLGNVLEAEHPHGVRVVLGPPPDRRTWPKLDGPPDDVDQVELDGSDVVWQRDRNGSGRWIGGHERLTWSQLRSRGEVKEIVG